MIVVIDKWSQNSSGLKEKRLQIWYRKYNVTLGSDYPDYRLYRTEFFSLLINPIIPSKQNRLKIKTEHISHESHNKKTAHAITMWHWDKEIRTASCQVQVHILELCLKRFVRSFFWILF